MVWSELRHHGTKVFIRMQKHIEESGKVRKVDIFYFSACFSDWWKVFAWILEALKACLQWKADFVRGSSRPILRGSFSPHCWMSRAENYNENSLARLKIRTQGNGRMRGTSEISFKKTFDKISIVLSFEMWITSNNNIQHICCWFEEIF